ncbi:MAG: hypothetical protein PHD49_02545 [Candidatus Shapirobacteria bacterium]|nr:hypothetical protein [Candidatus Shapirobacteria bacterium]
MIQNILEIEKKFPNWFNQFSDLSYEDQKYIWENIPLIKDLKDNNLEHNTNVNGNDNGACKQKVNTKLTTNKQQVIESLLKCNYRTPPRLIASYLEVLFSKFEAKEGHWLWIAQHYTPRSTNQVILEILKLHSSGRCRVVNPGAMFTFLIKKRKKRKVFRNTNGVYKQQGKEQIGRVKC